MTNVLTSKFRASFVFVFNKKADKDRYELSMLFPDPKTLSGQDKADYERFMKAAKDAADAAAKEKWGDKLPKNLKSPFLDAGNYEYDGYEEGMTLVRTWTKRKPGVVDSQKNEIIDESEFYPGCYARATIAAFPYDVDGNRGVGFYLNNIQKLSDGEPLLKGSSRAEDDFDAVDAGGDTSDSIFGGGDATDDNPFA